METNRIIKIESIQKIAKENGFKHICLINPEGIQIINFNPINGKITFEQNFKKICDKLSSPLSAPGRYKILMSEKLTKGYFAEEFYIVKSATGDSSSTQHPIVIHENVQPMERALTYEKAIEMNGELATLKAERLYLLQQIESLQKEVNELQSELEEMEQPLSEPQENSLVSTLKEYAPSIFAYLDRSMQLKEAELQKQPTSTEKLVVASQPKMVKIGSEMHCKIIDKLFTSENYLKLGEELNKIKIVNPDLYQLLLEKYQLTEESNEAINEGNAE